uniref:uncharacterized protein LOC101292474 n=1 Tax=Fragaria vesca subsp. vesca TaxID=101020 RepID=UPI0005C94A61|nr:PREDICTED: uncharacterized protein LOC101292474 [Fragaria vesca subsp. vesca]
MNIYTHKNTATPSLNSTHRIKHNMKPNSILHLLLHLLLLSFITAEDHGPSSIVFTTNGRLDYYFDIFTLPVAHPTHPIAETRITDGQSVNFNGHFPSSTFFPNQTRLRSPNRPDPSLQIIYVTERNGFSNIFYDAVYFDDSPSRKRSALEVVDRVQLPLLGSDRVSMKDKPSLTGEYLVYVSTHEDSGVPRTSSAAVYATELSSGLTRRLTPHGVADFSPAVSPSGVWTAAASYGEKGWDGEVEELSTDIYVFLTRDGTRRVKVVEHGGWPSWVDESTIYFHRRGEDQWWSIYRAILPKQGAVSTESVVVERITPPGLHAFTPATSPGNHAFIAVATRRPSTSFRHVELFDLVKGEFKELTRLVSPSTHHFNPFISPDSGRVGYHKCRGNLNGKKSPKLFLQNIHTAIPNLSVLRVDGTFPSFSPSGDRIAFANLPGVYVVNRDGSNRREVYPGNAFSTSWDPVRKGVVYTGAGPEFAPESTEVDIIAIDVDQIAVKKLTTNGKNNAFPSPSPDGKRIVFRSGRSGHKNLYIMDAEEGERIGLQRLTEGPWTDTMCNWSPDGDWIAFASDRENPGSGSFELYVIHPNGTGLRKVIQSGSGGRTNHPWFSPDGKSLVFTSDYGAISAEPISNPHHYQPYGEIFTVKVDGSDLRRLTQNSFEDGTPVWVPSFIRPSDVEWPIERPSCGFDDLHCLSNFPSYGGVGAVPWLSSKPQCAA